MKWYSIKKYKPCHNCKYLVSSGDGSMWLADYNGREFFSDESDPYEIYHITHFA